MKKSLVAIAILSLIGVVPVATGAQGAPTSLTDLTGAQIMAIATKAAVGEGTVTRTVIANLLGTGVKSKTTSTLRSGIQTGTVRGHKLDVVYLNGVVYVKLDAALLKSEFGQSLPSLANKWISFTKGHNYFTQFSAGLTLPSLVTILTPAGALSVSTPVTIDGQQTVAVSGDVSGTTSSTQGSQTVYVSTTPPFLPVRVVVLSALSGSTKPAEDIVFKNWGVPVTITRPSSYIASWKTKLG
jgi:hypothetical protein